MGIFFSVGYCDINTCVHLRIRNNLSSRNESSVTPSWVGLIQIYCQCPVQPRSRIFQCLCEPTGYCEWRRRHIMSVLNRWLLFNSRRLLLPGIHLDPLSSCFLTFQDKSQNGITKQDKHAKSHRFCTMAWLKQKRLVDWVWPQMINVKTFDLVPSTQYPNKECGGPIIKKHEIGARTQDSSPCVFATEPPNPSAEVQIPGNHLDVGKLEWLLTLL